MTKFTRHVNAIKEKIAKLGDELFSFLSLMILSSVEALFLFLFVRVHESVHDHFDHLGHSPLCPLKIAIVIMGLSFLLLNVVIVVAFVTNHIVATIGNLRSALSKKPQERRTKVLRRRAKRDRQSSPIPSEPRRKSVTITVVRGADDVRVSTVTSPSPRGRERHLQETVDTDKQLKSNMDVDPPGSSSATSRNTQAPGG